MDANLEDGTQSAGEAWKRSRERFSEMYPDSVTALKWKSFLKMDLIFDFLYLVLYNIKG